jgi:large subunit ribosomal protein L3
VPVLRTIKHLRSARPWGENSKRVGLLGIKCGMTRGWDAFGKHLPLTVIKIDHCFVTQVKPEVSPSGFIGIQVGASLINPKNVAKPQRLHLEKANLPPLRQMVEFQVTPDAIVHAGTKLDLRHFAVGQYIDVRGISCVSFLIMHSFILFCLVPPPLF